MDIKRRVWQLGSCSRVLSDTYSKSGDCSADAQGLLCWALGSQRSNRRTKDGIIVLNTCCFRASEIALNRQLQEEEKDLWYAWSLISSWHRQVFGVCAQFLNFYQIYLLWGFQCTEGVPYGLVAVGFLGFHRGFICHNPKIYCGAAGMCLLVS